MVGILSQAYAQTLANVVEAIGILTSGTPFTMFVSPILSTEYIFLLAH